MADDATHTLAHRSPPAGDDYLSVEALSMLTAAELTRRTAALAPLVASCAAEAERLRRPVDRVWNALRASGFFYQFVPKRFGGLETDTDSFIDASLPLAEACASTAWVATFCAEHNWLLAHFPEETQAALWGGDFPYIIAPAVTAPPGTATPTDGGFVVSGNWKWGTGVMHADWIIASALVTNPDGPPKAMLVLFPATDATVIDTWHVDGMAGTGSNDIQAKDIFVPTARTVFTTPIRSGRGPGSRGYDNRIYSAPMLPFLAMTAAIPALGAARATVAAFRERLGAHVRMGNESSQAHRPAAQIRLATAELMVNAAELLIRDAGRRNVALGSVEEPAQTPTRIAIRAQIAFAVKQCRDAALHLSEGAGSGVHMLDHPFQRAVRDINVVASHVAFDVDTAFELHGRALIGLPPNSALT